MASAAATASCQEKRCDAVVPPSSESGRDPEELTDSAGGSGQEEPEGPPQGRERRRGPRIDLTTLKGSWAQRREQRRTDRDDAAGPP